MARTSKKQIEIRRKQAEALELRKRGYTLQAIADEVGYNSHQAASAAIIAALSEVIREPAEALKNMELERLNDLYKIASVQAGRGNLGALDRCIRIMERRAKLLGLDAPARTDITSGGEKIKGYIGVTPDDWDG